MWKVMASRTSEPAPTRAPGNSDAAVARKHPAPTTARFDVLVPIRTSCPARPRSSACFVTAQALAELDRSVLGGEHRAEVPAGPGADADAAAQHRRRRDVGGRGGTIGRRPR
jgi:hypothetical protein